MNQTYTLGSSVLTTVVTGFVALLPDGAVNYTEKLLSVFVLAVVAEIGRRLVNILWKGKQK